MQSLSLRPIIGIKRLLLKHCKKGNMFIVRNQLSINARKQKPLSKQQESGKVFQMGTQGFLL